MPKPLMFEGHKVAGIEFEITGGGTHDTTEVLGENDRVRGWFEASVVNVKHPFKAGKVARVHTLNVKEAGVSEILEKYVAPEPQPTLEDAAAEAKAKA